MLLNCNLFLKLQSSLERTSRDSTYFSIGHVRNNNIPLIPAMSRKKHCTWILDSAKFFPDPLDYVILRLACT